MHFFWSRKRFVKLTFSFITKVLYRNCSVSMLSMLNKQLHVDPQVLVNVNAGYLSTETSNRQCHRSSYYFEYHQKSCHIFHCATRSHFTNTLSVIRRVVTFFIVLRVPTSQLLGISLIELLYFSMCIHEFTDTNCAHLLSPDFLFIVTNSVVF